MPRIQSLDHLVLTVRDIATTQDFYTGVLGMTAEKFATADGSMRHALRLGTQKINLHQWGAEFSPNASHPFPGSADLCFLSDEPLEEWQEHLERLSIAVEEGPIPRTGGCGPIVSLYIRDPDGNLLEIAVKSSGHASAELAVRPITD